MSKKTTEDTQREADLHADNEAQVLNESESGAVDADVTEPVDAEVVEANRQEPYQQDQLLRRQLEDAQNKLLRMQADFDNFRRRTRLEREDAAKYAALPAIQRILPALDNLERAIAASKHTQDFETLSKGVEMTAKLLLEGLQQEGLQQMDCVGQLFNPEYHQAVMQVESDEYGEGVIVETLQSGYLLKDKVIRPAMVKVNKA